MSIIQSSLDSRAESDMKETGNERVMNELYRKLMAAEQEIHAGAAGEEFLIVVKTLRERVHGRI